ncbi:hypothetical protein [Streptomyces siamensis]|uniref:Uncharacterized protein n=1 Tax=Streptomyces siamensis TaxID=1274986 RepID=A0ABP9IRL8_9ACTN
MRTPFAQEAVLVTAADGDVRAPGAAVTVALCGHGEHEPPCPLAPHHTSAERSGDEVRLRVLFAAAPADEAEVRARIESALSQSTFQGPDGVTTRWRLRSTRPSPVRQDETDHAERLTSPE